MHTTTSQTLVCQSVGAKPCQGRYGTLAYLRKAAALSRSKKASIVFVFPRPTERDDGVV